MHFSKAENKRKTPCSELQLLNSDLSPGQSVLYLSQRFSVSVSCWSFISLPGKGMLEERPKISSSRRASLLELRNLKLHETEKVPAAPVFVVLSF